MTTKERLHRLIDELRDQELGDAQRILEALRAYGADSLARALLTASLDDEPETDDEPAALAEARDALTRGDVVRDEDLDRALGW